MKKNLVVNFNFKESKQEMKSRLLLLMLYLIILFLPTSLATEGATDQSFSETMMISGEEGVEVKSAEESNPIELSTVLTQGKKPDHILHTGSKLCYGRSKEYGFLVSFDSGLTWEERNEGLPRKLIYPFQRDQVRYLTAIGVDPFNPQRVAVTTTNHLYLSENHGETWRQLPFSNGSAITSVALSPHNKEHILVGTSFAGFYETIDLGKSWIDLAKDLSFLKQSSSLREEISALAYHPENPSKLLFACGFGNGLYLYNKTLNIWETLNLATTDRQLIKNLFFLRNLETESDSQGEKPSWWLQITKQQAVAFYTWPGFQLITEEQTIATIEHNQGKLARIDQAKDRYGIYVRSDYAQGRLLDNHLKFMAENGLNAMVVDFKDDFGFVTYETQVPLAQKIGAIMKRIKIKELLKKAKEQNIYVIGRIVVFKDSCLYQYDNYEYAAWDRYDDQPWRYLVKEKNSAGEDTYVQREHWVDPFSAEVWEYNLAIAAELEALGVDEIQFDYIRFPTDGNLGRIRYRHQPVAAERIDALESFLAMARERLQIPISTDLYGFNCWYQMEGLTGQNICLFSEYVDVICPMYYPSHFPTEFFPGDYLERAEFIYKEGSFRAQALVAENTIIRPYVQAFLLTGLELRMTAPVYTEYLLRQVRGVLSSATPGFTLWNNSNRYYMAKKPLKDYLFTTLPECK
ncbi:MAG TPA: hypothetical protein DDZ91_09225 [Firmicutes bacterium]|nr:hypothetical protein [Bacillota bacterium]